MSVSTPNILISISNFLEFAMFISKSPERRSTCWANRFSNWANQLLLVITSFLIALTGFPIGLTRFHIQLANNYVFNFS